MTRLAILAACAIALCSCGGGKTEAPADPSTASANGATPPGQVTLPPDSPKLKEIRVQAVEMAQTPVDEVDAPGKIEVNPNRVAHVVLPLAGRIITVHPRVGDAVRQGETVVTIESPDADAAMSGYLQAQAGVTQAKANVFKAQADLDRSRDLFEHNAVARKDVLNYENAFAQASTALDQAQANLQQSLRRLEILGLKPGQFGQKVEVKAPISGKVLELTVVPGEYRNDTNASLMTIADLSTVWVAADVPESAIRFIKVGERLDIELTAYPGEAFRGRVTRLADTVDPQTRTIKVRAELDNRSGRLRPEMFGRIKHVESTRLAPVVPAGAVIQGDGQNYVYLEVAKGVFQQTPVKVGNRMGDRLPLLSGVKAGDRVVTDGAMLLKSS